MEIALNVRVHIGYFFLLLYACLVPNIIEIYLHEFLLVRMSHTLIYRMLIAISAKFRLIFIGVCSLNIGEVYILSHCNSVATSNLTAWVTFYISSQTFSHKRQFYRFKISGTGLYYGLQFATVFRKNRSNRFWILFLTDSNQYRTN